MSDAAFDALIARLGVPVSDQGIFRRALTHPTWALENGGEDYERLEFLGDAVLSWVVAPRLYEAFPDLPEGALTRMKIALTSGRTAAEVARELDLGPAIRFGRGAAHEGGRASVLENVFEALVGAVYIDSGIDVAREFVLRVLGDRISRDTLLATPEDAKSRLQALTQAVGLGLPTYEIVERTGPVHAPVFTAHVSAGDRLLGTGTGATKQAAQKAAAAAALKALDGA
jgi:ribonuclease-3